MKERLGLSASLYTECGIKLYEKQSEQHTWLTTFDGVNIWQNRTMSGRRLRKPAGSRFIAAVVYRGGLHAGQLCMAGCRVMFPCV